MKIQSKSTKLFVIPALLVVAIILSTAVPGRAQKVSPQVQDNSIGYSTGLIGIAPGQSVRLAAVNEGNLTIPFQFRIVDDQGFPLIQDDGFVPPGKSAFIEFEYFGKGDRLELNAQVRAGSDKALKELNPSLHVIDTASGKTLSVLGGGNFNSFTKMFDPPQQF
jgi:hypothetical protein